MDTNYARIRLPTDDAMARFSRWIKLPELEPPKTVASSKVVDLATKDGAWRSVVAVYVYESGPWAVFEDQTGYLSSLSADEWCKFAGQDDLVFAGYNDSVPYGQLIVIQSGRVVRDFLDDQQEPEDNVNDGQLDIEKKKPIKDWTDVALFVDEDEIVRCPDEGLLWMLGDAN
jgi:hypothetical protein